MKHYFYNYFLELNKSQHIEHFFEYSLMAIQKWLLEVRWFESDFSKYVSELESEQLEMENLTVQLYFVGRFAGTVLKI